MILIMAQCCGSVTFRYGSRSGSADPYLWLTAPDSDPDPTPDPAPEPGIFVSDLQDDAWKLFFFQFFLLLTIFAWLLKDPEPDPDHYLVVMDPDPDPGCPKHLWILRIRICNTMMAPIRCNGWRIYLPLGMGAPTGLQCSPANRRQSPPPPHQYPPGGGPEPPDSWRDGRRRRRGLGQSCRSPPPERSSLSPPLYPRRSGVCACTNVRRRHTN